jgi:hypothetical protein
MAFMPTLSTDSLMSGFSAVLTGYFWLVKNRGERENLRIFATLPFQATPRGGDADRKTKRLIFNQLGTGGVLLANNSTVQNSVLRFECFLKVAGDWVAGSPLLLNGEKAPWNLPPQTAVGVSAGGTFEVPEAFEPDDQTLLRFEFVTVTGKRFRQTFTLKGNPA